MCGRHPGRVERVGRMSGRGSPRHGWLSSLPSPPDGGEEDGEEDEAGRMTDRTSGCPSGCWSIGGEVVAMASTQSRAGCTLVPLLCWWCDPMSGWRWCGRRGQQTEQKRGDELAKMSAVSFALVLSLPSLLLVFVFHLYIIMYI